jgi:DNA-directed RNA polymerase specialized sigma24 family protein
MSEEPYSDAKRRLRKYFSIKEALSGESCIQSGSVMVLLSKSKPFPTSPQEKWACWVVDLQETVADVEAALSHLPEEYRCFLKYRFGDEYSLRATMGMMGLTMAVSTAYALEKKILGMFVKYLHEYIVQKLESVR